MPLILILWGTALLSLVTISLLGVSTTSQKLARNAIEAARIEAIAEAAVVRSALGLSESAHDKRWRADGKPERFTFNGAQVAVRIQDELGKIDINYADRPLLLGLLRSAGVGQEAAHQIVEAILNWRSPLGANPADGDAKQNADRVEQYRPRHGLFQSIDELRLVSGVTPEIFGRISQALTVYSQRQSIDPQLAPREALLAMSGTTPERVSEILAERENRQRDRSDDANIASSLRGRAFAIKIDIDRSGGKHRYEAVIRFTDDPSNIYWLLHWERGTVSGTSS